MSHLNDLMNERIKAWRALQLAEEELRDLFLHYRRIKVLDAREYKILRMRFFEKRTLDLVGREFDVTRDRIRMLETKALNKIKRYERKSVWHHQKVT